MTYQRIIEGEFLSRPNRFIAKVRVGEAVETVHVKNTGRCRELLVPSAKVYLAVSDNPARKTKYDLVAVEKKGLGLINMDSQLPNAVAAEWLKGGLFSRDAVIRREVRYRSSRFDFYIEDGERRIFLEVKGVTLEVEGQALFPDAPTERGVKHLEELVMAVEEGYEGYLLFVIGMQGVNAFLPNDKMHKAFGDALRRAREKGVKVVAVDSIVTPDSVTVKDFIPVLL